MNRSALTVLWLVLVWLALMESLTPGAVVAGVVVSVAIVLAFPEGGRRSPRRRFRPLRALLFVLWFAVKLVEANLQVAVAVVSPRPERLRRAIVAVPVASRSFTVRAVLANVISLTPGTFIVEIDEATSTYFVHFIDVGSVEEGRRAIHVMERMIARALEPTAETLGELDRRIEQLTPDASPGVAADQEEG